MESPVLFNALLAILPELILGLSACVLFIAAPFVPRDKQYKIGYGALLSLGTAALSLILLCGKNITAFNGMLVIDAYALLFKGILLLAAALTVLISFHYIRVAGMDIGEYYGLILLGTMGMMFLPSASDLLSFYLALELMSLSFYVLTAFMRKDEKSLEAGIKYFLAGIFTSGLILYGIALLYGMTGITHLGAMKAFFANAHNPTLLKTPTLFFALVLLVAGFGFKMALVPFHMWAPDVYEGAPTSISAFLSVGSKLAAFSAMLRVFVSGLSASYDTWWPILWIIAALTMTLGNIAALVQTNFKRLLAYSSIAHAGYLVMGLLAKSEAGMAAIVTHSVAYLFMTLGAFAMIILVCKPGNAGDQISDLRGIGQAYPFIGVAFILFALSLIGMPPTAGFIGKLLLFGAAIKEKFYGLAILGVLNSAISLYYYFKIATVMFMEEPPPNLSLAFSKPLTIGILIMSTGTLFFGLYPNPLIKTAFTSIRALF